MKTDEKWIREHLPKKYADEPINNFIEYDVHGLEVVFRERGEDTVVYRAENEEDLRLWTFREVCRDLSLKEEMRNRKRNEWKWRYSRERCENGKWIYVERRTYVYDAIEDSRLAAFEEYLKLIKGVVPDKMWKDIVREHVSLMNLAYHPPHWDYDGVQLCFIEISDSKARSRSGNHEAEPSPGSISKVIE